jgi:subtilase family serine protease
MRPRLSLSCRLLGVLVSVSFLANPLARAESLGPVLIVQNVDETKLVTLSGNTRPEANVKNDRGRVADSLPLDHMLLQLKRSPEQERELLRLIEQLTDSSSPNFHRWLAAKEFGERFGVVEQDRDKIKNWLRSHGFEVNVDYTNGLLIDFSGTAGRVREAFHTEIHELSVEGVKHIANMSDPQIPAALAPAIVGVVSLHDFMPHALSKVRTDYTFSGCGRRSDCYAVVPADLATIYNLNPLFNARHGGTKGQGQTIVVIEDSDVYSTADWDTFRSAFDLGSGSFTQIHPGPPSGLTNCPDPGVNPMSEAEAISDAEYASAAAPDAAIVLASCGGPTQVAGVFIALYNLLNAGTPPPALMSISYGQCEAMNGAANSTAFYFAYQQAATEGVSVFAAAGDSGAAGCDTDVSFATHGIGVSALASTPFNVAVGGTDFGDTYAGTDSTYWNSTNTATYGSAKSYVPEIPWNDSCASVLIATFEAGPGTTTYGADGFCNTNTRFITTGAGGGGPSTLWPKPSWQSLVGNPSDSMRDIPDISLFAGDGNGPWGHFYVFCWSDPGQQQHGAHPCTGAPETWSQGGGTSFAAPIMTGIQALVNQHAGGPQGNPNPEYYSLAHLEYGRRGSASCDSTLGNAVSSSCTFYDVTLGDMDVVCEGTDNCYTPSGTYGVLSTSDRRYRPAYGATTGWDFATGIGTVNAANLVNNWVGTTLVSSLNPSIYGQAVTLTATVQFSGSTTPTGTVNFVWDEYSIGTVTLNRSGVATLTKSNLNADSYPLMAIYSGDANHASSTSVVLNQVVQETTSAATISASPNPSTEGQAVTFTASITSPTVTVTGPVTFTAGNTVLGTAQLSGGKAKFTTSALTTGSTTVTATYYGDSNIAGSSASVTQVVQP